MVAAYERVVSSHHTDNDEKNLRTFLFNFANTFFREICSLFVTYLTKDRTVMISQSVHRILDKDEFSRRMENVLFGGTIMYYPDPFLDASQVSLRDDPLQKLASSRCNVCLACVAEWHSFRHYQARRT